MLEGFNIYKILLRTTSFPSLLPLLSSSSSIYCMHTYYNNMINHRNYDQQSQYCCNIHPSHVIIGICSLCLKERLLILASSSSSSSSSPRTGMNTLGSKTVIQKVSALSNSFLHRLNSHRQRKFDFTDKDSSSTSQEDSFISIKFGDDGCTSWDKGKEHLKPSSIMKDFNLSSKIDNHKVMNMMNKQQISTVVEHKSPRGGMLKWRKRVGHLFQLVRLKSRSSMANVCHVSGSKLEGVKIRNKQGWIKSNLTKRRKKKRGHETKGER